MNTVEILRNYQEQIPIVSDKALIDLINGIQVSHDLIKYGNNQGVFGRLWGLLTGSDLQTQSLLNNNQVVGQNSIFKWALELTCSQDISQVGLAVTQEKLLEAREAIRRQQERLNKHEPAIEILFSELEDLNTKVEERFQEHDARITKLEVTTAVDNMVSAWNNGRTYKNLGWAVQVAFLSREVFSKCVTTYEINSGDRDTFRQRLINAIIDSPLSQEIPDPDKTPDNPFCSLEDILRESRSEMASDDLTLASALLEIRSVPQQHLLKTPLLFTIGTALELATLPSDTRPKRPDQCAIELCRAYIQPINYTTDRREFVATIVQETANDCMAMMANRPIKNYETLDKLQNYPVERPSLSIQAEISSGKNLPVQSRNELIFIEHLNPKFGLVLAGGGAKGAYQAGVCKYLAEIGLEPQIIAGTSIGTLNGAVIASSQSFAEGVQRLNELWDRLGEKPLLKVKLSTGFNSIFDPNPIEEVLHEAVNPAQLRNGIKLWATVFPALTIPGLDPNLLTGLLDILSFKIGTSTSAKFFPVNDITDDKILYNLLLASAAIPLAFPQREFDGKFYVDGALGDNIPLRALADRGCTFAIVIHLDNGETWSRHDFSEQDMIEIRPQQQINKSNTPVGAIDSLLDFSPEYIADLKKRGYEDAQSYLMPILKTLKAFRDFRNSLEKVKKLTEELENDRPLY